MRKTKNLTNHAFRFTPEPIAEWEISKKKKNIIPKRSWSPQFSVVILGKNCVRFSDAALDDLFLQKFVLHKTV